MAPSASAGRTGAPAAAVRQWGVPSVMPRGGSRGRGWPAGKGEEPGGWPLRPGTRGSRAPAAASVGQRGVPSAARAGMGQHQAPPGAPAHALSWCGRCGRCGRPSTPRCRPPGRPAQGCRGRRGWWDAPWSRGSCPQPSQCQQRQRSFLLKVRGGETRRGGGHGIVDAWGGSCCSSNLS